MSGMSKLWRLLLGVGLFVWVDLACGAEVEHANGDTLHIGFYAHSINETASRKDIEIALNFWANDYLAEEAKKKYQLNISHTQALLFDDILSMQQAFRRGELDMIVAPPLSISRYFSRDEITTGFIGLLEENMPDSILLIARADSGINHVSDLKGKSFELLEGDELTEMFVDHVFLKQFHQSYRTVLGSIDKQSKASRIVLDVYFNKVDAGVVFKGPYRVMSELNPDIANSIKILDSYPSLSRNVSIFRKNYVHAQQLREIVMDSLKDNVRGKQILEMFRTPELQKFDVEQLDQFDEFNKEYQATKEKYGL